MTQRTAKTLALGASLAGFVALQAITKASDYNPLQRITIEPEREEERIVSIGQKLDLVARGEYLVGDAKAIRATWEIVEGKDSGILLDCKNVSKCTFQAGDDAPVHVRITAKAIDSQGVEVVTGGTAILITDSDSAPRSTRTRGTPEWAYDALVLLHQISITGDASEETCTVTETLTRGQLIRLLYQTLKTMGEVREPRGCQEVYEDVPKGHPAFEAACTFRRKGWAAANPRFEPEGLTTRGVAAAFIGRIVGEEEVSATGATFSDIPRDHSFFEEIATLSTLSIIEGGSDGQFRPDDPIQTEDLHTIMVRALRKHEEAILMREVKIEEEYEQVEAAWRCAANIREQSPEEVIETETGSQKVGTGSATSGTGSLKTAPARSIGGTLGGGIGGGVGGASTSGATPASSSETASPPPPPPPSATPAMSTGTLTTGTTPQRQISGGLFVPGDSSSVWIDFSLQRVEKFAMGDVSLNVAAVGSLQGEIMANTVGSTSFARTGKSYLETTAADCTNPSLSYTNGVSTPLLESPLDGVCFKTEDGVSGKLGRPNRATLLVDYVLW